MIYLTAGQVLLCLKVNASKIRWISRLSSYLGQKYIFSTVFDCLGGRFGWIDDLNVLKKVQRILILDFEILAFITWYL